jgi:putative PEP-CTERM system TPR-repeat lipoprotein
MFAACGAPDDPDSLIASAKDYMEKRDYNASVIQLKSALQKEPNNAEARYLLGYASLQNGDLISAEIELERALELDSSTDAAHIALARTLLAKGEGSKVIDRFGARSLSSTNARAELRALVGIAELARGRRDKARAAFDEALGLEPGNASASMGLARLAAADGNLDEALKRAQAAVDKAPSDFQALLLKANLLAAKGEPAEEAYRDAINAAPTRVEPRIGLMTYLVRARALDKAAKEVEALQKVAPRDLRVWYSKALVLFEQRKFAEAKATALQVLKQAPEHVPTLALAGVAAFQTGAYAEAEGYLRKAVFKAPDFLVAKRMLAATHLRMNKRDLAMDEVRELLGRAGQDADVLALAGEVYMANGDVASAARHYERAHALLPNNARLQTRLAHIRIAAGDADKGFAELEAISANQPDEYQADLVLVSTHLRNRDADNALLAVQRLESKQPANPITHNLKGLALLLTKDFAKARASFERAVQLNPTYMPAVRNLARLDLVEKKPDEAKKRYEAVLQKEPSNEVALLDLAVLLRVSGGNSQQIEKLLKQSVTAHPSSPAARAALINHYLRSRNAKAALSAAQDATVALPNNPAMIEALGFAQVANRETRAAVATFTRLAEMVPESARPHMLLASAYRTAGQADEAIKSLRKALQLQPDLAIAHRQIASLYVRTNRADQAVEEARSVQAERPGQPFGHILEAEIYVAQKKWNLAERKYKELLKTFDRPGLVPRTHAVMQAGGKEAEADAMAEEWVKRHPEDSSVLAFLAQRDLAAKRYAQAVERYELALKRTPDNPQLLNNLAWASYQLKKPDALRHAERAHELAPDSPAIMDTLGNILAEEGDMERGLELLGRAAELAPGEYRIRLNFARALIKANRKKAAREELEALSKQDEQPSVQQEATRLLSTL